MTGDPASVPALVFSGITAGTHILLVEAGAAEGVIVDDGWARQRMTVDQSVEAERAEIGRGEPGSTPHGYRIERGAALVPVVGSLVPRGPVGMAQRGMTSYAGLRAELARATADAAVSSIVLMIDSPGGIVSGVDMTANAILRARQAKPVIAMVEGQAASAAYWLASQCEAIVVAPLASVGSIGALRVHVDVSRAMGDAGLKVTLLHAGARKVDGNPYEPLSDGARAGMQGHLDQVRLVFAKAVAAGRNKRQLDGAAVLATEARMFDARQAVGLGLADRIGTLDDLLAGHAGPGLPPPSSSSSIAPARKPGAAATTTQPLAAAEPQER